MSSQQQYLVTASAGGRNLGVWDMLGEVEITADVQKRRGGGMGKERTYAALPTYSDTSISRVLELARDHELVRWLDTQVGRTKISLSEQPLDEFGNRWGKGRTITGRINGVTHSEVDSESGDLRTYTVSIAVEGIA